MNVKALLTVSLAVLVLLSVLGGPAPALAAPEAVFTVNSTLDEPDAAPGSGGCASTPSGVCTLRAAIMEANFNYNADIIILPASAQPYQLTRPGVDDTALNGDLDINTAMTITGGGAANTIIDGGHLDRVFQIGAVSPNPVIISGVTIRHGRGNLLGGGAIYSPYSYTSLTLSNSVVTSNEAMGDGAGIFSNSAFTMTNTLVTDNHAYSITMENQGGGLYLNGASVINNSTVSNNSDNQSGGAGGIMNFGTLTLNSTTVSGNTSPQAYSAGGISNLYGTLTLNSSTVTGNTASSIDASAGGIVNSNGTLTLNNSVISNNIGNGYGPTWGAGGGLYNSNGQGGSATLNNSTVSGNSNRGNGGGIYNFSNGVLYLRSVTITNNRSNSTDTNGSQPSGYGGGIANGGTVYVSNTIIAGNWRNAPQAQVVNDCSGSLNSDGYNLFGASGDCFFTGVFAGNLIGNPLLGPLANNGGPTQTHALLAGSLAIDAGNPGGCANGLGTDQRGFARITDGDGVGGARCDIGAFEFTTGFYQVFVPLVGK